MTYQGPPGAYQPNQPPQGGWDPRYPLPPQPPRKKSRKGLWIALGSSLTTLLLLFGGYTVYKLFESDGVIGRADALSPSECYEQVTKDGGKWSRMGATSLNATESLQDPLFASVMDIDNATIINTYTPEQIELAQESMNLLVSQINAPEGFKIEELARYRWGVYGEESGERSDGALGDQQNVCASFVTDDFEFYENKDPNYKRGDIPAQYRSQG